MAGDKLIELQLEIQKYLGVPYFINKGKHKTIGDNAYVGKGSAKEIALATIDLANKQNIKLLDLSNDQIYNFQKKNHLGIDCSGLACQLLNFYFSANLDVRKTSANMLTSAPLSKKIKTPKTGDLIRQDNGNHVLFITEVSKSNITYVHASRSRKMVIMESKPKSEIKHDGFYRLLLLN